MELKHSKTAKGVKTLKFGGAVYEVQASRTTGLAEPDINEAARKRDAIAKQSRLSAGSVYQSSLQFGRYRGTPIAVWDELKIIKVGGELAPGARFHLGLRDLFPPISELTTADDTQTAEPSVGHVSASIPLNFVASMPQPVVHVAAPPAQVHVVNELPPPPPPPPPVKELRIIRDDDGKITGALMS